jgi:hypothetical protein
MTINIQERLKISPDRLDSINAVLLNQDTQVINDSPLTASTRLMRFY